MDMNQIWICDLCGFKTISYKHYRVHMEYTHRTIMIRDESKPVKKMYAGYSEKERKMFNEISFRNLVEFYKEELVQIDKGVKARDVLSQLELKNLVKKGILKLYYKSGEGKIVLLTEDSEVILGIS